MTDKTWVLAAFGFVAVLAGAGTTMLLVPARASSPEVVSGRAPQQQMGALDIRRAHADTCTGYNLELQEAASIQQRLGKQEEAQRLLGLRQDCGGGVSPLIRSAR